MRDSLAYVCAQPWAILSEYMETIIQAAEREADVEAVAARLGRPLENTGNRVETHGSVAVLGIEGPVFRYANVFTRISGATSVQLLARDLQLAVDDPRIESILLNVDSPGGEVAGISEMAMQIRRASARKPVWVYTGDKAASAAYWLASAAKRIVAHESAWAGSIGVIATVFDDTARREKDGVRKYEFISSQSPLKQIDPATEQGKSQIKSRVDTIAEQFIAEVARYRSVTPEHVMERFGRGDVVAAPLALTAGMVDALGNFEDVVAEMNSGFSLSTNTFTLAAGKEQPMADEEKTPLVLAPSPPVKAEAEIIAAERARTRAILSSADAQKCSDFALHLVTDTDMSAEAALTLLAKVPKAPAAAAAEPQRSDQFAEHMRGMTNPKIGVSANPDEDETAAEVGRIVAHLPEAQRRKPS